MKAVAVALALSLPACTLVGISVTSSTVKIHNEIADDDWSYPTPVLVGAALGAIIDIMFLIWANRQWAKPMT